MNIIQRIFRSPEGKSYAFTFLLVTSLFFVWGFCNGLLDILNKHFQNTLHISKFQSGFVQSANFIAYFLMAIPAGLLAKRFGYKGGILIGLALIVLGAFWFIPATQIGTYWAFLVGIFVIASGMTTLETLANPYTTVLGPKEGAAVRINMAATINGLGATLGPIVGGYFVFADHTGTTGGNQGLSTPYIGIGLLVLVIFVAVLFAYVPDIHAEEENPLEASGRVTVPLIRRKHFVGGVIAQFLYVAAQVGIMSFVINYVVEYIPGTTDKVGTRWFGLGMFIFLIGRLLGSFVVGMARPQMVLAAYAVINVLLTLVVIAGFGKISLIALLAVFFFMSIMFPTIFALGIHGLGEHTKFGSSILVMSIVGGAIAPPLMGRIADLTGMRFGFVIPLVCFAGIAIYGLVWKRLNQDDSEVVVSPTRGH
jgi:FHS family L-fucose permease-like MFS transporter